MDHFGDMRNERRARALRFSQLSDAQARDSALHLKDVFRALALLDRVYMMIVMKHTRRTRSIDSCLLHDMLPHLNRHNGHKGYGTVRNTAQRGMLPPRLSSNELETKMKHRSGPGNAGGAEFCGSQTR